MFAVAMVYWPIFVIGASIFGSIANAQKVPNYVGNRTTMVHLFEWKWNDIAEECERFLGPIGFAGVQVSPIQENVVISGRPWYERYQPISYAWETRSGSESEFRAMVRRCNRAGVRIYVDMLLNHMSADQPSEPASGTGNSSARPHDLDFPAVPYRREHFHPICAVNDWQNVWEVRNCEIVGLHDLDQSQQYVRDKMVELLNRAVDAGVAGFRIDAAKHMWPEDLKAIYSSIKDLNVEHGFAPGSRAYIYQEVIDNGNEVISKYEYNGLGAVTEFRYGNEVSNALLGRNPLKWFNSWGETWGLLPSADGLVFIDNHDTQRHSGDVPLTYKNPKLYKMAVAFMLAHPYGNPRVMSSFDFTSFNAGPPADGNGNILSPTIKPDQSCGNGWVCEHRWRQIYNMVVFRNYAHGTGLNNWWDNGAYQISFCRGNRGFIAINADNHDLDRQLQVCLPAGVYCDVISGNVAANRTCTGKTVRVDGNGSARIVIRKSEADGVLALHVAAKIA